jgi:hypothetical protein
MLLIFLAVWKTGKSQFSSFFYCSLFFLFNSFNPCKRSNAPNARVPKSIYQVGGRIVIKTMIKPAMINAYSSITLPSHILTKLNVVHYQACP